MATTPADPERIRPSSRFRWPFSLEVMSRMDAYRSAGVEQDDTDTTESEESISKQGNWKFRWPFSLEVFHRMDAYRARRYDSESDAEAESEGRSLESEGSTETELVDKIFDALVKSQFDHADFVPEGTLDPLVTNSSIGEALGLGTKTLKRDDALLVEFIRDRAVKIFAISIFIAMPTPKLFRAMKEFQEGGFDDKNLPVDFSYDEKPPCFPRKVWTRTWFRHFYNAQWTFLAPNLSNTLPSGWKTLERERILPLTYMDSAVKEGSFGRVFKVAIHKGHCRTHSVVALDGETPSFFALKQIRDPGDDRDGFLQRWESEVHAGHAVAQLNHAHIVGFISAFERDVYRYLLFEWADGGSILDFWRNYKKPRVTADIVLETISQFAGLADALFQVHNYASNSSFFRHGDLKPENILRFQLGSTDPHSLGQLKVADWGLAKEHKTTTQERQRGTETIFGTKLYEPPEVWTDLHPNASEKPIEKAPFRLSRMYDIWSVGCILLEHIIWLVHGYDGLERFHLELRGGTGNFEPCPFYQICEDVFRAGSQIPLVHMVVQGWMDDMLGNHPRDTAIGRLVHLVKEKLLVVSLPSAPHPVEAATATDNTIAPSPSDDALLPPGLLVQPASMDEQPGSSSRPTKNTRATAEELRDLLNRILDEASKGDLVLPVKRTREDEPVGPNNPVSLPPSTTTFPAGHASTQSPPKEPADLPGAGKSRPLLPPPLPPPGSARDAGYRSFRSARTSEIFRQVSSSSRGLLGSFSGNRIRDTAA